MHYAKGATFEMMVTARLSGLRNSAMLSNIKLFSYKLKKETEIDRLLLTPHGVYCIEAKSFRSKLIGNFDDYSWYGWSGNHSTEIYNPIFQNFEHIRTLRNNIRRNKGKVFGIENVVIVPDTCTIESDSDLVMNLQRFIDKVVSDSYSRSKIDLEGVISSLKKVRVV